MLQESEGEEEDSECSNDEQETPQRSSHDAGELLSFLRHCQLLRWTVVR